MTITLRRDVGNSKYMTVEAFTNPNHMPHPMDWEGALCLLEHNVKYKQVRRIRKSHQSTSQDYKHIRQEIGTELAPLNI